ncbi:MAG: hypothetical protein DMG70_26365 [Acidobacteria bacterium]|nr:MAG: hypothetical protein DMG70_26365 [Acidobacteriota bacterium]PYY05050.1 MAG: hypothetical protein DMG69_28080 [Acidobacteriota bacterium]
MRQDLGRSQARRVLVDAANDPSALGALRAFQETGRIGPLTDGPLRHRRQERRALGARRIAQGEHAHDRLGRILPVGIEITAAHHRLAPDILEHKPTPPAVFMKHQLITRENVNHFYPNDWLIERLQQHA